MGMAGWRSEKGKKKEYQGNRVSYKQQLPPLGQQDPGEAVQRSDTRGWEKVLEEMEFSEEAALRLTSVGGASWSCMPGSNENMLPAGVAASEVV